MRWYLLDTFVCNAANWIYVSFYVRFTSYWKKSIDEDDDDDNDDNVDGDDDDNVVVLVVVARDDVPMTLHELFTLARG